MFGDKLDSRITMLQRVVALLRDLLLGVVALLTTVIVALGGTPEKLTALDWASLLGAALLIILGPIAAFLLAKLAYNAFYGIVTVPMALVLPDAPLPKGPFAWLVLHVFRMSHRQYVRAFKQAKAESALFSTTHPRVWKVLLPAIKLMDRYAAIQVRTDPYLFAFIALIVAAVVFKHTLGHYVPTLKFMLWL